MKRIVLCVVIGMSVMTLASARDNNRRGWDNSGGCDNRGGRDNRRGGGWGHYGSGPVMAPVSVTGSLTIERGSIALRQGDTVYLLPGLQRFVGFIDSLKEGAQVSVDGFAAPNPWDPQTKYLRVTRLNIGGRDYNMDFGPTFNPRR